MDKINSSSRQSLVTKVAIERPLTTGFRLLFLAVLILTITAGVLAVHSEQEHKRAKRALYKNEAQIASLREQVESLSNREAIREEQFSQLSQTMQLLLNDGSQLRLRWLQDRLQGLVLLAEQALQLRSDASAAIAHLRAAEALVSQNSQPLLLPLQRALREDITQLGALQAMPAQHMATELQALAAQVAELRLQVAPDKPKTEIATAATDSVWEKGWAKIKRLVVVRQLDEPVNPLLDEAHLGLLKAQLSTRLLEAELALLRQDAVFYVHALSRFEQLIHVLPAAQRQPLVSKVNALATQTVAPAAGVLASRQALDALPPLAGKER